MNLTLSTRTRSEFILVTRMVAEAVRASGIAHGICLVSSPHTTAGVFVNENADPDVARDVNEFLDRLVPEDLDFRHAEGNSDAHVKTILVGNSVSLPIRDGELSLGTWQGIYFAEFDGPRQRRVAVDCVGIPR